MNDDDEDADADAERGTPSFSTENPMSSQSLSGSSSRNLFPHLPISNSIQVS